jgi:hypothetical protein
VPKALLGRFEEIVSLTDAYCETMLDAEFKEVCRLLAAALSRKRPSPLASGRVSTWALAIAYAAVEINFGFDPSMSPSVKREELAQHFGLSQKTGALKASEVCKLLKTFQFDPKWTVASRMLMNPYVWVVQIEGGFLVDAREMPRDFQEEAFRRGAIPFVPGGLV